jgi:tRNA-2-methylthio-N6-dimethylallyladenosine synthase
MTGIILTFAAAFQSLYPPGSQKVALPMQKSQKIYIETYGCQMNFSDSEIVASILQKSGFTLTKDLSSADIIFVNTCSIRDHAEQKVRNRLHYFRSFKKRKPGLLIGLLGCMADRTTTALVEEEKLLDLVAGPDSYRDLPRLLSQVGSGQRAVNTLLSSEETYAEITPVRIGSERVTAFISIMRGCENYCSYCVVPSTRGVERSRDADSILREASTLFSEGYREVTLLGQNVNSYRWTQDSHTTTFPDLLEQVALISPLLRVRFATSHPKDLSDDLLSVMARHPNLCRSVHLPVQSGSNAVLDRMNRKYTREQYLTRIEAIRRMLPGCTISTDIITGFCGETEEDHLQTLTLMQSAGFESAFMFKYSERPQTLAAETLKDDVPNEVKERRLREVIELQQVLSLKSNRQDVGNTFEVLVESGSRRSDDHWSGRTTHNKVVVFPKTTGFPGTYVQVRIRRCTSATLIGEAV